MDPTDLGSLDENDPQSVARLMKKMGKELGEDVSEIEETMMAEASESGDTSDQTSSL